MPRATGGPLLSVRTLNRTLLQRQGLLERRAIDPATVVEQLVGLQAQEPIDPYVGLWTRIIDVDPVQVSDAIADRRLLRIGLMRTTLHLVTVDDALGLQPVMDDVLRRTFRSTPFAKALGDVDRVPIEAAAREILEERPRTPTELGRELGARWPDRDATAMAYLARYHLGLVQVPPRGLWRQTGRATNTTLEAWTGRTATALPIEAIVVRYLRAFGPATVADIRTWSWLTGLREVVERLRPTLRTYRDEAGRELFDVEDGVIADPDLPAPVRFLPQYDNVFLSHDDRSRIHGDMIWGIDFGWKGVILVDGVISGAWRVRRAGGVATMTIELGPSVTSAQQAEVEAEGQSLGAFLDPGGTRATIIERVEAPVTP